MKLSKPLFLFIALLISISVGAIITVLINRTAPKKSPSIILPTQSPIFPTIAVTPYVVPLNILTVPTYTPNEGQGINISSPVIRQSQLEIQKLAPYLPYNQEYTLSNGQKVNVVIPTLDVQNNSWTLTVQIFNLNYQVTPQDPLYDSTRTSFIEAANRVFSWMESNKVDPRKIFISWGDNTYIQEQAEKWLQEN